MSKGIFRIWLSSWKSIYSKEFGVWVHRSSSLFASPVSSDYRRFPNRLNFWMINWGISTAEQNILMIKFRNFERRSSTKCIELPLLLLEIPYMFHGIWLFHSSSFFLTLQFMEQKTATSWKCFFLFDLNGHHSQQHSNAVYYEFYIVPCLYIMRFFRITYCYISYSEHWWRLSQSSWIR